MRFGKKLKHILSHSTQMEDLVAQHLSLTPMEEIH